MSARQPKILMTKEATLLMLSVMIRSVVLTLEDPQYLLKEPKRVKRRSSYHGMYPLTSANSHQRARMTTTTKKRN